MTAMAMASQRVDGGIQMQLRACTKKNILHAEPEPYFEKYGFRQQSSSM